ncbi:MAG: TetR/AcrR family transcriptional regulator [Pseudomonadota bacterium]
MSERAIKAPSETEQTIIAAATRCFVRFGARKTSMNDIAETARVSRQTLYDLFGGKDELIRASIRSITAANLRQVRNRFSDCASLSEKLDAYFEGTVVKSFELLQAAGDPEDLISGHNEAGKSEIERSHRLHEALIGELLAPHAEVLAQKGHTESSLAHFIVTVVMGLKNGASDHADLESLLGSLKKLVLLSTGQH